MNLLAVLLALSPVIVIFLLLILRRTAADMAGVVGWVFTVAVAWLYFQTPLRVALQASLAGVVASLPIALVVATSILQVTIMIETGAIARVVALIKIGRARRPGGADHAHQRRLWHAADRPGRRAGLDPAAHHDRPGLLAPSPPSPCRPSATTRSAPTPCWASRSSSLPASSACRWARQAAISPALCRSSAPASPWACCGWSAAGKMLRAGLAARPARRADRRIRVPSP